MTVVVHGRAHVRPDKLQVLLAAAVAMSEVTRTEPGCSRYQFTRDVADPNVVVLLEEWESEDALQAHLASPGFAEFAAVFQESIEEAPEFRRFDASNGRPLFGADS